MRSSDQCAALANPAAMRTLPKYREMLFIV